MLCAGVGRCGPPIGSCIWWWWGLDDVGAVTFELPVASLTRLARYLIRLSWKNVNFFTINILGGGSCTLAAPEIPDPFTPLLLRPTIVLWERWRPGIWWLLQSESSYFSSNNLFFSFLFLKIFILPISHGSECFTPGDGMRLRVLEWPRWRERGFSRSLYAWRGYRVMPLVHGHSLTNRRARLRYTTRLQILLACFDSGFLYSHLPPKNWIDLLLRLDLNQWA